MTSAHGGRDGGRFKGSAFLAQSAALDGAPDPAPQDDPAPVARWTELAERNAAGVDLLRQDRADEAADALHDVVTDCAETLGPQHPDTLVAAGNLAVAHAYAGRLADAVGLLEVNLAARAAVLGDEHPRTLDARDTLGTVLRLSGRAADAALLHSQVASQRTQVLGPTHSDTLVSRLGLVLDAADVGDFGWCAGALDQLLPDTDAALGPRHHLTTHVRATTAAVALALGRVDHAVTQLQLACLAAESVHGPAHPDTVALRAELAEAVSARSAARQGQVTSPRGPSATREGPGHHRPPNTDR